MQLLFLSLSFKQWRRSVVKYGGLMSGSVRSSHQTVSGASKNQFYLLF